MRFFTWVFANCRHACIPLQVVYITVILYCSLLNGFITRDTTVSNVLNNSTGSRAGVLAPVLIIIQILIFIAILIVIIPAKFVLNVRSVGIFKLNDLVWASCHIVVLLNNDLVCGLVWRHIATIKMHRVSISRQKFWLLYSNIALVMREGYGWRFGTIILAVCLHACSVADIVFAWSSHWGPFIVLKLTWLLVLVRELLEKRAWSCDVVV